MAASTAIMHSASTNGHLVAGSAGALGSSANSPDSSCPENRSNPSTSSSSEEEDDSHHPVQSLCTKSSPSKVPPAPSKPSVDNADSALVMTSSDDDEVVHDAKTCETVIVESGTDVLHSPKAPTITPPPSSTAEEADDNSTIIGDNDDEDDSQQSIEIDSPLEQPTKAVSVSSDTTTVNAPLHHSDHSVASPSAVSSLSVSFNLSSSLPTKKVSTGKLEKITERLAKKQSNGQIPTNLLESLASLRESASSPLTSVNDDAESIVAPSSVAPPESSATTISEDGDEDDVDEEDDDLDEEDEDEGMMMDDEEDSEEIKNGFMALGLMGNVAFMGEEKFKCPVCGLQLDSQHTFTLHIRSHNPNDHSNTCRLCGKTLSSASSLDRHMLIHSGERPFKCSICNMAFTTNGNMHRHMRTHGHGTIGYTPRGAKRRAKLFAQQAAKVAAAAAAGEPVDAATISKLKKSALEVTTGNGKSPISGTPMKKQRGGRRSSSDPFGGAGGPPALDSAGSNPAVNALEAGRIAEAAAAFAAAVAATSEPSTKSSHKSASKNTHSLGASHSHHTPSMPPSATSSPNVPINLAAFAAGWPELAHLQASNPQSVMPQIVPQKGKPGRKKKIRPDMMQPQQQQQHHQHAQQHQQQQSLSHSSPEMSPFPQGTFANLQPTVCPICAMSVRSKMDLHVHMANFHAGEKLFCLDCGMILDNYNIYTQHHCTVTAPAVMTALAQNPAANADLLFRSTNTSRMNFSSARYPPGMSGASAAAALGNTPLAPHNSANLPQDALGSLISQLNKTLSQQVSGSGQFGHHSSKDPFAFHQQTPPPAPLSRSHHNQGPSLDLSSKSSHASMSSAHSFRGGQCCNQCNQKFLNTKHLKHHIDTFCHQCSLDCVHEQNYQAHLFQHSLEKFPALSKALGGGKGPNGFNSAMMAAAFPALMSQVNGGNPLMAFSGVGGAPSVGAPQQSSANFHKRNSYPKANSSPLNPVSLDLSISSHSAASSIASLTSTMADMKPDLADIQSIISMTKHAKLPSITSTTASTTSTNTYKSTPMSLSPNRASDAGIDMKKAVRTGDATNHPDSPASADSAAAAVVASSNGTNNGSQLATTHSLTADSHHHSKSGSSHLHEGAKTSNGSAAHHHDQLDDSFNDEEDEGELDDSLEMPSHKSRRRSGSPMKGDGGKSGHHSPNSSTQRFRCEQCRLSFKSMNAFRRHNRGHTAGGGHSHACHLCPYKSLDKSTLIRHLRTHNGERPFQCAICKYAFTTKANCERHVRKRHRNLKSKSEIRSAMQYNRDMAATAAATKLVSEKIFIERDELPTSQDTVCKQCGVDFGANRELRAHLRVPNNPCSQQLKPFVCTICKIGFNTRNNCVRHIIKQHPATIEVTDEEAAKVAAAVTANGAGDATAESLLMVETGSNPSLSPNSGGHMSGHSGYSDRSFSGSDHGMSECESYGTFDEEPKSSPLVSPNSNASFAALCQVAAVEKRFTNGSKSPELLAKKAPEPFIPLNLTMKSEESEDNQEDSDVLDLSRPKRKATATVPNGLDLSVKIPKLNGNHSIKMEPECEPSPLQHFRNQAAASNLLSLYGAAAGGVGVGGKGAGMDNFMQDMNQAMAAFAAKSFSAGGHHHPAGGGISNETLANLMAQFHQHQQQQQFAAMKPSTIGNKNH